MIYVFFEFLVNVDFVVIDNLGVVNLFVGWRIGGISDLYFKYFVFWEDNNIYCYEIVSIYFFLMNFFKVMFD